MTKDKALKLAREDGKNQWPIEHDFLKRFEALIRADERDRAMRENAYVLAEREACAKLLEESSGTGKLVSCMSAAAAIRARGNT